MENKLFKEAEKQIEINSSMKNSDIKPSEDLKEKFDYAAQLINDADSTEKSNLQGQLKQLEDKYNQLNEYFGEKLCQEENLKLEIGNCNKCIEGYIIKLKDKEKSLWNIEVMNQEDNEMNINYEKEMGEVERKIQQKQDDIEHLKRILITCKDDILMKTKEYNTYLSKGNQLQSKISSLQEELQKKNLDVQSIDVSIRQLNESLRNRSISPRKSPKKGDESPYRLQERLREIRDQNDLNNSISLSQGYLPKVIKEPDQELRNSNNDSSRNLICLIIILLVIIIALLVKKFTNFE